MRCMHMSSLPAATFAHRLWRGLRAVPVHRSCGLVGAKNVRARLLLSVAPVAHFHPIFLTLVSHSCTAYFSEECRRTHSSGAFLRARTAPLHSSNTRLFICRTGFPSKARKSVDPCKFARFLSPALTPARSPVLLLLLLLLLRTHVHGHAVFMLWRRAGIRVFFTGWGGVAGRLPETRRSFGAFAHGSPREASPRASVRDE